MSFFITLEGPDGCGKSTQTTLLAEHLRGGGHPVEEAREPGGTEIGDQIRQVVLNRLDNTAMDPRTEFLLFSASRAQLVREIIQPSLEAGRIVVCDRFFDSSLAYQGYGHGLDLEALRRITAFATRDLTPDLTLLFDLPVETGLRRRKDAGRLNRLDAYDLDFHERARQGYLDLARHEPQRWIVVEGDRSIEAVQADVRAAVDERLAERASRRT